MSHPFFEAVRFPWWQEPEAGLFFGALVSVTPLATAVSWVDGYYQRCAAGLPPLTPGQAANLLWREALEKLAVAGALRRLCEILHDDLTFQNNTSFRGAVRAVIEARPAKERRVFGPSVAFLDRENLRRLLGPLGDDANPLKAVLLRGPAGSGKSHSRYLFERAARERGAVPLYLEQGMMVTGAALVGEIFAALDSDSIPEGDTTDPAWYRVVCRRMQMLAARANRSVWIAVDDLGLNPDGSPLVEKDIRLFCDQVVQNMVNPPFRERFRLLLIDYPSLPTPPRWNKDVWVEEATSEGSIGPPHVEELLSDWAVARQRTLPDADRQRLAAGVFTAADAAAPNDKRPRLERIHEELLAVLNTL